MSHIRAEERVGVFKAAPDDNSTDTTKSHAARKDIGYKPHTTRAAASTARVVCVCHRHVLVRDDAADSRDDATCGTTPHVQVW